MNNKTLLAALGAASLLIAGCSGGSAGFTNVIDDEGPTQPSSFAFVSWTASSPQPSSAFSSSSSASVLSLPGLGGDFVFEDLSQLVERPNGSANLIGWLSNAGDPSARWWIDLDLSVRRTASAPKSKPDLRFEDGAYVDDGGPLDPSNWRFYRKGAGTLVGGGSLAGALAQVTIAKGADLQLGRGADNLTLGRGAQIALDVTLIDQPLAGSELTTATESTVLAVALMREGTLAAFTGKPDPLYSQYESGHALWFPSLGGVFDFSSGGELFLHGDGTAELFGEVAQRSDPENRFQVDLRFKGRVGPSDANYPPPASPRLELFPEAYVENGGPVDASRWTFFTEVRGVLLGRGDMQGARVRLDGTGPAAQMGQGANGKNTLNGLSNWIRLTVIRQPDEGPQLPAVQEDGDLNVTLGRRLIACVVEASGDSDVSPLAGGHAFWLPGIGTDFVMRPGGHLIERSDGSAVLRGVIERSSDPAWSFRVDLRFSGRRNPRAPNSPPEGSPKKHLFAPLYKEQGGPIDTKLWHYYTQTEGELVGQDLLAGALLEINRRGPAFQVGEGASGMDLNYGASAWITATVLSQPSAGPVLQDVIEGDTNITLQRDCKLCPREAVSDPVWSPSGSSHALTLPGIAKDLVFEPGSTITMGAEGSAHIEGVVVSKADSAKRFAVDVTLCTRLDPGDEAHAPQGSPKLELYDEAYVQSGGPVDPSTWIYFTETKGVLTGLDDWAGAVVLLSRMGPAFQIGVGASGKNVLHGGSGWLIVEVEAQPDSGENFDSDHGDFNLEFVECP